jgi:hypothetical protein
MDEVRILAPGATEDSRTSAPPRRTKLSQQGTARPRATERAGVA